MENTLSLSIPRVIRYIFSSSFLIAFSSLSASDVTVNFTGTVIAAPCTLSSASTMSVDLGEVTALTLATKGYGSTYKFFTISFTNCPASTTKVLATFSGTADGTNSSYYANSGTAKNVALDVTISGTSTAPSNGSTLTATVDSSAKTASFPFAARMISTGTATVGTFNTQMLATITYQ